MEYFLWRVAALSKASRELAFPETHSVAAFLIRIIPIIVAQAYRWLCSGWVLPDR